MEERSTGMSWIAVLFVIIVVVALFGGNFGGGLEYDIDSKLTIGFEGKYQQCFVFHYLVYLFCFV